MTPGGRLTRYRTLLYGVVALVLLAGLGASLLVQQTARDVAASSRAALKEGMAEVRSLDTLRTDLLERERLAYEAYGAIEPVSLADEQRQLREDIEQRWPRLREWGLDRKAAREARTHWRAIQERTDDLYANLEADGTNWDAAREQLAAMTRHRESLLPYLDRVEEALNEQALEAAAENRDNLAFLSRLVLIYTGIISLIALLVAWLLWQITAIGRRNQSLAEFPERNPNPVLNLDTSGRVLYANPATQDLAHSLDAPGTPELVDTAMRDALLADHEGRHEVQRAGRTLLFEWHWLDDLARCHVYISDITAQRQAEDRLRRMAYEDEITGLPNRAWLLEALEQRLDASEPGILVISLDRFGTLTAQKGFESAYAMLAEVGHTLERTARARFGGEAVIARLDAGLFAVLLPTHTPLTVADAEALRRDLPREVRTDHALFQTHYHLGLRPPQPHQGACPPAELLRDARTALLAAEAAEGERVAVMDQDVRSHVEDWSRIEASLHDALRRDRGLQLFIQPKIRLEDEALAGGEFLIRWEDPELGRVSPGRFIPVAEQSGLILELGEWVLDHAVASLAAWEHDPDLAGFQGAVNIAAPELHDPDWAERVLARLEHYGLPPERLEAEVTERVLAGSEDGRAVANLRRLRQAGVAVSIDDFGTGYSSLAYIHRLPISRVKVDKQFVDPLPLQGEEIALARVVVEMAEGLGLETIAEGIEHASQGAVLRAMGCRYGQGFHYARPMPIEELGSWKAERNR